MKAAHKVSRLAQDCANPPMLEKSRARSKRINAALRQSAYFVRGSFRSSAVLRVTVARRSLRQTKGTASCTFNSPEVAAAEEWRAQDSNRANTCLPAGVFNFKSSSVGG